MSLIGKTKKFIRFQMTTNELNGLIKLIKDYQFLISQTNVDMNRLFDLRHKIHETSSSLGYEFPEFTKKDELEKFVFNLYSSSQDTDCQSMINILDKEIYNLSKKEIDDEFNRNLHKSSIIHAVRNLEYKLNVESFIKFDIKGARFQEARSRLEVQDFEINTSGLSTIEIEILVRNFYNVYDDSTVSNVEFYVTFKDVISIEFDNEIFEELVYDVNYKNLLEPQIISKLSQLEDRVDEVVWNGDVNPKLKINIESQLL